MEKIFLIDGSSMLSTQYFGTLPFLYNVAKTEEAKKEAEKKIMQTTDGIYTNATYGMSKVLLKLIKEEGAKNLAVCWDVSRETFRRKIYPEYKAHRKETDKKLSSQFETTQKMLEYIGIPTFKLVDFEADDIIGTIAKKMSATHKVIILTKDQDALQLINENTTVWLNTKEAEKMITEVKGLGMVVESAMANYFPYTEETFTHFYGIKPKQIIDLKAIDGDKSDGIPGINGYGVKKIVPMLQNYGTIEGLYEKIISKTEEEVAKEFKENGIKGVKKEKLMEYKEQVEMSKKLATIDCDIGYFATKERMEYALKIDEQKKKKIFERLGFKSLIE